MLVRALCIVFLGMSCVGILCLVYYFARKLRAAGVNVFILFMMSIFIYSLGYLYELSSDSAEAMYLALKIEYLGVPFVSVLWFVFALEYNECHLPRWKVYPALFVVPLITTVMLHTNMYHFLHYKSFAVDTSGPFPVAATTKGIWYDIDFAYKTLLNFLGTALFIREAIRSVGYRRKQAAMISAGAMIIWSGNVLTLLGASPYGVDLNPFFLAGALPLCAYAMFRLRMFDIVPIARDKVFKTINTSVIVLDKSGRIVDFNDCAKKILPDLNDEALGLKLAIVLSAGKILWDEVALENGDDQEIEFAVAGRHCCFHVSCTPLLSQHGENVGRIVSFYDVTESRTLLRRMEHIASIDALTQVYARRFFMEAALSEICRAAREKGRLSFLLLDIDYFKRVNDTHGHLAGDKVLRHVAEIFKRVLRDRDLLGRYGGEEFAIVLPNTDLSGAQTLAERLRSEIEQSEVAYEDVMIPITISGGVVSLDFNDCADVLDYELVREKLLKASDQALYCAKEAGRNRICEAQLDALEAMAGKED